jgi:hypothetical protein
MYWHRLAPLLAPFSAHLTHDNVLYHAVTSGLNFTQNHRFEFAAEVAAGAVD